jgi:hypothetical protein
MEVGKCGVCGSWRRGDLFPSGNEREDGTTPHDNFVCARCQRDVREVLEIERALDEYEKGRGRMQAGGQRERGFTLL